MPLQEHPMSYAGTIDTLPVIVRALLPAALALAFAATIQSGPVRASALEDYYRTMYVLKFCHVPVEGDEEASINIAVEEEVVDNEVTSEEIAPIFEALNSEYNADPAAFCEANMAAAQQVVDEQN
jgi:hypothetical protein